MSNTITMHKLDSDAMWKDAQDIANSVYETFSNLEDDDKMLLRYKFYNRAFDLTHDIAESAGSILSKDNEFSLAQARRSLFGIKNAYKYIAGQSPELIEPETMLKIDKLTDMIDTKIKEVWNEIADSVKGDKA